MLYLSCCLAPILPGSTCIYVCRHMSRGPTGEGNSSNQYTSILYLTGNETARLLGNSWAKYMYTASYNR